MSSKIGRLAMREEGKFWNAYYAQPGSMQDALLLGSIHMALVSGGGRNYWRKQAFMEMMKRAVSDLVRETSGEVLTWSNDPQPAPEHERIKE